ncbi:hypothetical protein [Stenotrophomonas bentonitica]|uniref:hypothetical protein n=1 Tax=Stenotrophomonas bentonitica TaxID=1450134 RepID=UPI00345EF368
MTTLSIQHAAQRIAPPETGLKLTRDSDTVNTPITAPIAAPMDAATARLLSDAVAKGETDGDRRNPGEPMPQGEPILELPAPKRTLQEAGQQLASVANRLPVVLAALLGSHDPITAEEGAALRAVEAAAAMVAVRAVSDTQEPAKASTDTVGQAPEAGKRNANAGAWLASSKFAILLELLRQVLLQLAASERENSADSLIMKRDQTERAGDLGIKEAETRLAGAAGAAVVTGAVGGAAMHQAFKSTSMQTSTTTHNNLAANKTDISVESGRAGLKGNTTPSQELRPARDIDGSPSTALAGSDRRTADLQADVDVNARPMNANTKDTADKGMVPDNRSSNAEVMARAQNPAARAAALNMLAQSLGNIVPSGTEIEAAGESKQRQMATNASENYGSVSEHQQQQVASNRDLLASVSQLLDEVLQLQANTSGHQISRF